MNLTLHPVKRRNPSMLRNKEEIEGISYIFLQLDRDGSVVYSNSDVFEAGMQVEADSKGMIQRNHYVGVEKKSQYGFSYALLMPVREYIQRNMLKVTGRSTDTTFFNKTLLFVS